MKQKLMALEALKSTVKQLDLWMTTGDFCMLSDSDYSAMQKGRAAIAALEDDIAQGDTKDARAEQFRKELAGMHHDLLVVMQAAWIEWQRGKGAESAMQWIENTLAGPGLIPCDDEPYSNEPQAYFDKNKSDPFPECFCGRPSNQLWMGKGFCSDDHYKEHRAAISKATAPGAAS